MKRMYKALCVWVPMAAILLSPLSASAGKTTLKAVCFLPKSHRLAVVTKDWVERVNNAFEGKLAIKYIGGPEVTASKQQIQALQSGIFDVNFNVASYYSPLAPELNVFQLSRLMPWEERRPGGFYDYMKARHERIGVRYLGRWLYGPFFIWTKTPVSSIKDLAGLKLRTGPMYIYFMNKLGVSAVSIKPADVYTALERGTVDGFAFPLLGPREMGWTDTCKYLVDHPFYTMDGTVLFNLNAWKRLSEPVQKKLIELTAQFEKDMVSHFNKEFTSERKELEKAGVHFLHLPPDEAKHYVSLAEEAYWENIAKKVPDLLPDLRRVSGN